MPPTEPTPPADVNPDYPGGTPPTEVSTGLPGVSIDAQPTEPQPDGSADYVEPAIDPLERMVPTGAVSTGEPVVSNDGSVDYGPPETTTSEPLFTTTTTEPANFTTTTPELPTETTIPPETLLPPTPPWETTTTPPTTQSETTEPPA